MEDKSNKPKLKPAKRYVSKEKVSESSDHLSQQDEPQEQEHDDEEVIVPDGQQDAESPPVNTDKLVPDGMADVTLGSIHFSSFSLVFETLFNTVLNNRAAARQKALEEKIEKQKAEGIDVVTNDNALPKCVEFINLIKDDYNMYREQKNEIGKEQAQTLATVKTQADTAKRLETVIGRIEKVQGIKAPIRPPFPSWACLAYLFWHWPMYAFAWLWLSKYFRRFCFLITFFVILIQTCYIFLLANDNRTMRYEHDQYVTVRNWLYVTGDTAATNRFNKVELLYRDVDFNKEEITRLNEYIQKRHEQNLKRGFYMW